MFYDGNSYSYYSNCFLIIEKLKAVINMEIILSLLIICITFIVIIKIFVNDKIHDMELKIGESCINIKKHEKE